MKRITAAAAALLAVGLLAASAQAEEDPYASAGEKLYHENCGSCHGVAGKGDGPVATMLDPKPADLTKISARHGGVFPEAKIIRMIDGRDPIVAHGTREMPVWGLRLQEGTPPGMGPESFARGQVLLLLQYLKSIQQ